ncbi:MAG: hypothetical protein AB7U62_04030 [Pseudolabrys sp.]
MRDLFGEETKATRDDVGRVTLTLMHHGDAGACIKVSETGDLSSAVLLPKSQIEVVSAGRHRGRLGAAKADVVEVAMPEWLAKDRGLL